MEKHQGFIFSGMIIGKTIQPDGKGGSKHYIELAAQGVPDVIKIKVNESTFGQAKEHTTARLPVTYSKFNNQLYWQQAVNA